MSRLITACDALKELLQRVETAMRSVFAIDFRQNKRPDVESVLLLATSVSLLELTEEQRAYIQELAEGIVDKFMEEMRVQGTSLERTQEICSSPQA